MSSACLDAVLKYMVAQNRPYSATDVTQNLRGEFPKAGVQKALEQLAQQGRLLEKEAGKSKVYCAVQRGGASREEMALELSAIDANIVSVTANLRNVEQQVREADALLKDLLSAPTTDVAETEADALGLRVDRLRSKVADLADSCIKVSPEDRKSIARKHETVLREYRKRKRLCNSMLDLILEGYPKSKKELIAEIEIETDEDAGVKL